MNGLYWLAVAAVLGIVAVWAAAEKKNELPAEARMILERAESFELYSLNPAPPNKDAKDENKLFHDYGVMGKTVIEDAETRKNIRTALLKGIAENTGIAAACFNPRHGLRASHEGKTVDLVICFECLQIQIWNGDKKSGVLTTASPQPVFDKVLKDAGVTLAAKPGK